MSITLEFPIWPMFSRKRKLIFIPDSPQSTTSTMTTSTTAEENNNNNGNGNNGNNNNNDNQIQEQFKEQQQPQIHTQQQQAVVYPVSIKIDQNSSWKAKINIHMYGVDPDATKDEAIRLFVKTQDELKAKGIAVLKSNSESEA